jgi:hypothetical protein
MKMSTPRKICDILCEITLDENGFVDVDIAGNQPLFRQWIVRGATSESSAIRCAEAIIPLLCQGKSISHHDPEGRIMLCSDGLEDMRRGIYERRLKELRADE